MDELMMISVFSEKVRCVFVHPIIVLRYCVFQLPLTDAFFIHTTCCFCLFVFSKEIKLLRFRFREIDEEKREWVVPEALIKFPEIALNPLRDRVLSCFDVNKDGKIDFKEFISVMSVFSADGPRHGVVAIKNKQTK